MSWITEHQLPFGEFVEGIVDFLVVNFSGFFDAVSDTLSSMIHGLTGALLWVPPSALILLLTVAAYLRHRRWGLAAFTAFSFLLIWNIGYWEDTMATLSLVLYATLLCVVIGIPLGIYAAHSRWLYKFLQPMLDLMQTIPPFVYLIPTLTLFGLGVVPGVISTVIFAIAAPVRLTHLGISQVPKELVEAGKAFGCTNRQLLFKVELPAAMSSIGAGITQCIMLSLSMVVIAALVGADGLGVPVVRALNTVDIGKGFEAGLAIVLLAIWMDRFFRQSDAKETSS
ncbi:MULTISPECIES: choline ABC transporter permease subunit [Marinobacter]|jgi:glycine betaine/proline transport system permease protein|uniref:choline ABC transporter permease subunit n=1 Tax=Marinobacter TaxID=2742 RepID=UPI0002776D2C|nr:MULTISPECIES: choline ABC transporter permease subunit [Marinobacter]AFP30539.1 Glycine betaine transport system permease protein opuAB [Marinobacter sp. BSs20148]MBQ0763097.1 choline ABC transporter permease subunit [Marinobacter psychrophilus]MBQ0844398.1 choline ABC transporter permease subunit [Marinobacter psychrophilus]